MSCHLAFSKNLKFNTMKFHTLIIALVAFIAFGCTEEPPSAPQPSPEPISAKFAPVTNVNVTQDTLETSSSTDTAIFDLGTYGIAIDYDVQVSTSVETGTGNYTYYVQVALNRAGTEYATLHTLTNTTDTSVVHSGTINGGKLRVLAVAPSSTQLTTIRPSISTVAQTP